MNNLWGEPCAWCDDDLPENPVAALGRLFCSEKCKQNWEPPAPFVNSPEDWEGGFADNH